MSARMPWFARGACRVSLEEDRQRQEHAHPALDTPGVDGQLDEKLDDGLKIVTVQGKNVEWRCFNGTWSTKPPSRCANGKLVVRIKFPDCL
jgi:hypothetical protein